MSCCICPYVNNQGGEIETRYCKKLGSKIITYGPCEEDQVMPRPKPERKRKWNRYERKMRYKNKLKRLYEVSAKFLSPAYPVGEYNYDTDEWESIKYYKRYYKANHAPGYNGFLKKLASKKFRRFTGELKNGCAYKKTFDYWWELL